MKTQKTTTASKMINRFDRELRALLMNDLSVARSKANLVSALQSKLNSRLSAA